MKALRELADGMERDSMKQMLSGPLSSELHEGLSQGGPMQEWLSKMTDGLLDGTTQLCPHIRAFPLQRSFVMMWDDPMMLRCVRCADAHNDANQLSAEENGRCDLCKSTERPIAPIMVPFGLTIVLGGRCEACDRACNAVHLT